jgi:hypothetical protein
MNDQAADPQHPQGLARNRQQPHPDKAGHWSMDGIGSAGFDLQR